jgi:hypothetical protein
LTVPVLAVQRRVTAVPELPRDIRISDARHNPEHLFKVSGGISMMKSLQS